MKTDSFNGSAGTIPPSADAHSWQVKIDYLSFTSKEFHYVPTSATEAHFVVCFEAARAWRDIRHDSGDAIQSPSWRPCAARSGYTRAARHSSGARYFAGHASAAPLIELPGAACDQLRRIDRLAQLVSENVEGITRLDLAGDLVCDLSPAGFVSAGYSSRVRTRSSVVSATGCTEYLGSPKSDRFVRVYRYAEPHPRADALRVEVVLRRELAKSAAQALLSAEVDAVWRSALQPLSFKSASWGTGSGITLPRLTLPNEPTSASRMRWLEKQIRPAVIEAHRAGLIDLERWLTEAGG